MAKNKAANITSLGTYLYKNDAVNTINIGRDESVSEIKNLIRIPNIKNIEDTVLSNMTKHVDSSGNLLYYSTDSTIDSSQQDYFDFSNNVITMFTINNKINNVDTIGTYDDVDGKKISQVYNLRLPNKDLYGTYYPFEYNDVSSISDKVYRTLFQNNIAYDIGNQAIRGDQILHTNSNIINRYIKNSLFLNCNYDLENDRYLIPLYLPCWISASLSGGLPLLKHFQGANIYKEEVGFIGGLPIEWNGNAQMGRISIAGDRYSTVLKGTNAQTVVTEYFSQLPLIIGSNEVQYAIYIDQRSSNTFWNYFQTQKYTYSYGFITDDDDNIYIYIYCNSPAIDNYSNNPYGYSMAYIYPIEKLKGRRISSYNEFGQPNVESSVVTIQNNFDIVSLIKSLLGDIIDEDNIPVPAPDAYGPGNPYQDTNNAGSSIGGNFDFDDVIETNDATPNTGFDTFDYQTSLFGTYVMSNKNIKDYTHTLSLLYEHSADILFGSVASAMAGRIVEGTTGLFSLPITIPSANYTNTTFSIGNTGIADGNATYAELSNGKFTTANYLTKNMIEYTINMEPIKHRYDNFLDFPPYSSASIYIPYIGTQELPLGLIQSTSQYTNTLQLKVRVDVPTGDFVVILFSNGVPITHWNGNCARPIQLAVNDNSQIIRNVSNQISKAAGAIGIGAMTGGVVGAASQLLQTVAGEGIQSQTPISTTQHKIGNIQNSGVSGWMDNQQFYIIVERPVMYLPYNYGHHIGYPTDKVVRIGSCEGFCQFGEVHLECSANQAEKDEITRVLQKGVILNVS